MKNKIIIIVISIFLAIGAWQVYESYQNITKIENENLEVKATIQSVSRTNTPSRRGSMLLLKYSIDNKEYTESVWRSGTVIYVRGRTVTIYVDPTTKKIRK